MTPNWLAPQFYIYVILCVYIYIFTFLSLPVVGSCHRLWFQCFHDIPMLTDIVGGTLEVNHHSAKHTIMCMYIYIICIVVYM